MRVSAGVCVPEAVDMAVWFRSRAGECVLPLYKFHFLKWQLPYKRGKKKEALLPLLQTRLSRGQKRFKFKEKRYFIHYSLVTPY